MYNLIKSLYRLLPEKAREMLRPCIPKLLPIISKKERMRLRWLRTEYTPFHKGQRNELLLSVVRFCNANRPVDGYYFEFGCYSGTTMSMAWHHSQHLFDWTYVGFDSFEGLPEIGEIDRQEIWQKGKLATGEREFVDMILATGMPNDRLKTVRGFYDQSLNESLQKEFLPTRAAVVYIDCDLYESTVPVLKFIVPFLQKGTVVVFDDWNCFHADPERGERRAWREFLAVQPDLQFEEFVRTAEARAFICVKNQ